MIPLAHAEIILTFAFPIVEDHLMDDLTTAAEHALETDHERTLLILALEGAR